MQCKILILVVILSALIVQDVFCKRSGGRSSSTKSRSTSLWGNNTKKKSNSGNAPPVKPEASPEAHIPATKPKPSAPKMDTQSVQKSSNAAPGANSQNNQRPIGWNLGNQNGQPQTKSFANQQHSGAYGQHVQPSQTSGFGQSGGVYSNYGGHNMQQPAHSGYAGMQQSPHAGYGGMQQPSHTGYGMQQPNYGGYNAQSGNHYSSGHQPNQYGQSYNQHNPYPGYYPSSNVGVIPPRGANAGQYYNNQAGFSNNPQFSQHGNNGGGVFGSMLGGRQNTGYGYGGHGNYGGYGGGMMGGFGGGMMQQKRGFGSGFATTAFTSVATGLLVWSLMRGGRSQNYNVYNHYNNPQAVPQNIPVAANVITLCSENATLLCAPNTVPLCTSNETILCVVTAGATVPCVDNATASCVDTKLPCTADCGDNKENTTFTLPCIANATVSGQVNIVGNKEAVDATMGLFNQTQSGSDTVLCVITMAMPSSEEEEAARKKVEEVLNSRSTTTGDTLISSSNEPEVTESSSSSNEPISSSTTKTELAYAVPFLRYGGAPIICWPCVGM